LPIRVVVAEDNLLVREGLRQLLATVEDIDVVAVCEGRDDLFDTIERESPDVVLTDIRMPPGHATEGIEVANQLRQTSPAVGLVALSQFADAEYALQLFEGGSSGRAYLLKERVNNVEQIASALRDPGAASRSLTRRAVGWRTCAIGSAQQGGRLSSSLALARAPWCGARSSARPLAKGLGPGDARSRNLVEG
jgi:DNA-binding NarL/FixJ family response regulator